MHSPRYPAPDALRAITWEGAIESAGPAGFDKPTDGSRRIIESARRGPPLRAWLLAGLTETGCAVSLQRPERGPVRVAWPGDLAQAMPGTLSTGEKLSTSVKALITFAWL
jgi:hypothetical protein